MTATGAAAEKGRPLKCRLCHGKLILNAKALRQHLESRKHEKRVDKAEAEGLDAGDDFCFAEDYQQVNTTARTHSPNGSGIDVMMQT